MELTNKRRIDKLEKRIQPSYDNNHVPVIYVNDSDEEAEITEKDKRQIKAMVKHSKGIKFNVVIADWDEKE